MKIKRLKQGGVTVLILMLMCMCSTVMAYNKDDIDHSTDNVEDASVAVAQTIKGDYPEDGGIFTYQITAITDGAPMPKDGDTLTLAGDSYGYFRFDFSGYEIGQIYRYEIRQEQNSDGNFSWDQTVYDVYFQILRNQTGGLEMNIVISNGETKDPIAEYTSTYTAPVVEPTITPVVPTKPNTYTGLMGQKGAAILAGIVILAAAGSMIVSKKKHQ